MKNMIALIAGLAVFLPVVTAECPNACSAHGKCGAYDMCICYRNWMSNDCSERICQFGLAHVDTPKGDLDSSSGALSGPGTVVVPNDAVYPFGTTEQYPNIVDGDGNPIENSAHEYRECSNKGICDRSTGNCNCFDGYDGSACQRASCPSNADGMCSGHGVCESIKEIAARDFGNVYNLWDEHASMGCVCDPGYSGSDCSERVCKWGADPLYYDDSQNMRYSNWTYQFYTKTLGAELTGNYSIVFYDAHGEDWQTAPLDWNATCETVTAALEDLPNNVIPKDTVRCYKGERTANGDASGQSASEDPITNSAMYVFSKYTLAFPGNPGKLKQISINKYLDGSRPTLFTDETTSSLGWHVYPNGFTGENWDMVPDLCEDVTATLLTGTTYHTLVVSADEAKLLKKCLGDGNGDDSDNIDVYNWDQGNAANPHLIKLIEATQDTSIATTDNNGDTDYDLALSRYPQSKLCSKSDFSHIAMSAAWPQVDAYGILVCPNRNPPGFYAVLYSDGTNFRLYTRSATNFDTTTQFYVYTTTGYLQQVNPDATVFTVEQDFTNSVKIDKYYSNVIYATNNTGTHAGFYGDMSCENTAAGDNGALDCVGKDDYVMILNTHGDAEDLSANPIYPNLYQVKKIGREQKDKDYLPIRPDSEENRHRIVLDYSMNANFVNAGGFSGSTPTVHTSAFVYKFYPPAQSARYNWAGECSNRGLCNTKTGLCQCFGGFTGDNCDEVNALSN